jgi:hypothetical protein
MALAGFGLAFLSTVLFSTNILVIKIASGSLDLELEEVEEVAPTTVEEDRGTNVETHPLRGRLPAEAAVHDAPARRDGSRTGFGARFKRWARRTTIGAALILVTLGGAFYFARPHLPAWATQPVDNLLRRLPAPLGPR